MPRVSWTVGNHTDNALLIALAFFFVNAWRVVGWLPAAREADEILGPAGRGGNKSKL